MPKRLIMEDEKLTTEPEPFKELEDDDLTAAFILSEAAREIDDDPVITEHRKAPQTLNQAPEEELPSLPRSKLRSNIVILDEADDIETPIVPAQDSGKPAHQEPRPEVGQTETSKYVFKFAPSGAPTKPKSASEQSVQSAETERQTVAAVEKQTHKELRQQTEPKFQQRERTHRTLAGQLSLASDEDAEKIWTRFTALRDELFYGADHELTLAETAHGNQEDESSSPFTCLGLKWETDSAELLERFVTFSQWVKQVLLVATNQVQSLHEAQSNLKRGNLTKSANKFAAGQTSEFNPFDSLYFQSFVIGVEEVVYSLSSHIKSMKAAQAALGKVESTESDVQQDQIPKLDQKVVNLANLQRSLQAVKKSVVYLKIETKSRDSIEELVDLANSLLSDTLNSEARLTEYFSRYPQIVSSSKSIKYRPPMKPEDSQIELVLTKILKRQDHLFEMKKGTAKIVGLLKAIASVYGRYEHPTVFIHSFEPVVFAVEFVECIIDGLLEGKKPKPISLLIDLLDCLHNLRSVSKAGRSTKFTTVLLQALEASKSKLFVTDIVQIYGKWVLMHSSTEMNEYNPQIEQVNELLLLMYKETSEFRSGMIPFAKQLGMLHALSKSKILDREILFETLQAFLKEGLESLDLNLMNIRRFFRCLSQNYYVIAEEPKLLNILYEHITAQLPELKEALKKSPDPRDRRYSAISVIYSLAVMFPPAKIGLHAEYILGEVKEDVELSLTHGYTKPEVLMLGGILELMKGIWTFPGDLGVRIIQQVKAPGFFRVPTPSMAAFEVAEILGKLKVKHRMEANLGHMVVDIIVESTLPGEIELAIDVHGPPHEFRNSPTTLGNQQFKSRLLRSIGIGYFQVPLNVWSLLDTAGKKSYLLKGIRVLRDKGRLEPEDPAKDVVDANKIVMKKPRKKSPTSTEAPKGSTEAKRTRKAKVTKGTTESSATADDGVEQNSDSGIVKKPRAKRTKKVTASETSIDSTLGDGLPANTEEPPAKPKRVRKSSQDTASTPDSDQPKPKRTRKAKQAEQPSTPQTADKPSS